MMVLWLLILRGISIEFRNHIDEPRLAAVLGRGLLPARARCWRSSSARRSATWCAACRSTRHGDFFLPLWTDFRVGAEPGILDWYTVLVGVPGFLALALHGALWVALKTEGAIESRARRLLPGPGWVSAS